MNTDYTFANAWPRRIGLGAMLVLLILSAVFYKERTLFADIAYQTFLMIQEGGLQVQVFRFGSAIVHILPYLAIKAELGLPVILMLYSISFTLLYLGLYLLIVNWLKNDYLGLVLVFLFTLTVYDGFYWATSEFQQGLAFSVFFFAFLLKYPKLESWKEQLFVFLMVPTLVFYHPLMFVPFFFFWVYGLINQKNFRTRAILLTAVFFVLVMVLKHFFAGNWYDSNKFSQFSKALKDYYPNYLVMPVNKKFITNTLTYWYFFPLFYLISAGWHILKKNWLSIGLVLLACLGYIALVHIGSPNATYRFYIEVSYMPLTIFVMLPVVFEILPKVKLKYVVSFFGIIFAFRLAVIAFNHKPYTERLSWISSVIEKERENGKGQLLVMQNSPSIEEKTIISWGVAYESILITAIQNPENPACLLILQRNGHYKEELEKGEEFLTTFKKFSFEELDKTYFQFKKAKYEWIE